MFGVPCRRSYLLGDVGSSSAVDCLLLSGYWVVLFFSTRYEFACRACPFLLLEARAFGLFSFLYRNWETGVLLDSIGLSLSSGGEGFLMLVPG